ncbi:MAG: hypothetical protein Q9198_008428 [Flavoplaca austrocitrina]
MNKSYVGYSSTLSAGPFLRQTRDNCQAVTTDVTACVLATFTETEKALYGSRQYVLTLWPAFVGAIVALAPDPANMLYDNMWWAALFAVTSGGLPGLDSSSSPPHHVEAYSEKEARAMCESWRYTAARPKLMSKMETMGNQTRGQSYVRLEWIAFFVGCGLWLGFCIWLAQALTFSFTFCFNGHAVQSAVWYYISCSPAVGGICFELLQDRVEVYEPMLGSNGENTVRAYKAEKVHVPVTAPAPVFKKVNVSSVFALWLRLAVHQWRRTKYRILVKDASPHWFFLIGRALVGIGRVAVFALGSIAMGNVILLPVPDDLFLFVLLLFTTAAPRQLWPGFWANGNRGADLVVFVNSIRLIGIESDGQDVSQH